MSQATDIIQAVGALLSASASVIAAPLACMQLRDRRASWLPEIEASIEYDLQKNRTGAKIGRMTTGSLKVRIFNPTNRTIVLRSVQIKRPANLFLVERGQIQDKRVKNITLHKALAAGESFWSNWLDLHTALTGSESTIVFTVSLQAQKSRKKRITINSTIN